MLLESQPHRRDLEDRLVPTELPELDKAGRSKADTHLHKYISIKAHCKYPLQ